MRYFVGTCISIHDNPTLNFSKYADDIWTSPCVCQLAPIEHRIKVYWIILPTFQNSTWVFVEAGY